MAIGGIAAIGAITSLAGTALGVVGQFQANKAAKKAERARQQQARLEAQRARREAIRRSVVARAQSQAAATNQGAQFSSSALGAQSQATAAGGRNVLGINQNEALGDRVFAANRKQAAGNTLAGLGSGLQSFGSQISNNLGTFNRVGGSLFG